jgi:predicted RNA-binding Zn ribbon-like protein
VRWAPELDDERLLLDLINSTPVTEAGPVDLLTEAWASERGGSGSAGEADRLRRARDLLQSVVRGDAPAVVLEPLVREVRLRPEVLDTGLEWWPEVPEPDDRLAVRAVSTWSGLAERMAGRLRPCANDECRLFLLDRSHANAARWCSMKSCGNRMKARRHYRRART